MKGRNISSNIRKTIEIIEYTKKHNIPAAIMSIDFEKCFDRIEHSAIIGALAYWSFVKKDLYLVNTQKLINLQVLADCPLQSQRVRNDYQKVSGLVSNVHKLCLFQQG